jgi:DNA-binding transcriptional regulator GbsR (MarR family)
MKNTDPPHQRGKSPKITPELSKFIESMGIYFENQGVPRIGGRILALLMIAQAPLSAEEIGASLKISRGSISTNMRILTAGGLAEKVTIPGNRTTLFEFPPTALEKMIENRIQSSLVFKKIVEQGLDALTTDDFARHRLESAAKWTDLLIDTFQGVMTDWQARHRPQPEKKRQNKPSKLIDVSRVAGPGRR